MSMTAETLVSEALALSPQARAFVAERLIESLDADVGTGLSPAWREEVLRRCEEADKGQVELLDASEVFAKAYAALE